MKKILMIIVLIIILGVGVVYFTHRSVDQELSEENAQILENLSIQKEEDNLALDAEKNDSFSTEELGVINEETVMEKKDAIVTLKSGEFNPDAEGSDKVHRGWGSLEIIEVGGDKKIVFSDDFKVTNGPAYRLYLSKEKNIETEEEFSKVKDDSFQVSSVKQFSGSQIYDIDKNINIDEINSVVIWCESFSEFITSAELR